MNLIDGKALAASIRERVKADVSALGVKPKLAVVLVGDDAASSLYVSLKEKAAAEVGIETRIRRMKTDTSDTDLSALIDSWNADKTVDGILIQLPLPPGHDTDALIARMNPAKDVDGFHPANLAALAEGKATMFSPVHEGILRLIAQTGQDMRGAQARIIANSTVFAVPLGHLLRRAGCAVEIVAPDDANPRRIQSADIVVVAVGRPRYLTRDFIKSGAVVIDVGTNRLATGKVVGDVDAERVTDIPGWLSPVPGGVGPMTVALLLNNVLLCAKNMSSSPKGSRRRRESGAKDLRIEPPAVSIKGSSIRPSLRMTSLFP